ncbi:MAG: SUMF1/EgtB/PvdO family nonheme iron enzyme [Polyangiaceae bacterium]
MPLPDGVRLRQGDPDLRPRLGAGRHGRWRRGWRRRRRCCRGWRRPLPRRHGARVRRRARGVVLHRSPRGDPGRVRGVPGGRGRRQWHRATPECAFNTALTHTPDGSCPSFTEANELPVWCVDWCDAHAFCKWSSKRLCGKIGGGSLSPLDANVTQEEWYFACSRGYQRKYPYGATSEPGYCNIPEENTATPDDDNDKAVVGSFAQCEGGFDGIFDMQGNVAEWTDWCEGAGDGTGAEECRLRGGHTFGTAEYWSCDNVAEAEPRNREDRREGGFRCCKDAGP